MRNLYHTADPKTQGSLWKKRGQKDFKGQTWWVNTRKLFSGDSGVIAHMRSQQLGQHAQDPQKLNPDKIPTGNGELYMKSHP